MQIGDIAVAFVAFISLIFLLLIILNKIVDLIKNWRATAWFTLIVAAGGIPWIGCGVAVFIAVSAYIQQTDRRIMQQCTTFYERRVNAYTAPDDYFGQQLRKSIANEAKQCAEYASTKRTSDLAASTPEVIYAPQR